ncbi:MAG: hypothetical protein EHM12_11345 [Dehalococcoidia bacterium]|nr:MAG: hypothetical protein EHM12_11345 [Dehalococcoidia bacterium]
MSEETQETQVTDNNVSVNQDDVVNSYLKEYEFHDDSLKDNKGKNTEESDNKEEPKESGEKQDKKDDNNILPFKPKSIKDIKQIPQDFTGSFFKKTDSGIDFDAEKHLKFAMDEKPVFEYKTSRKIVDKPDEGLNSKPVDEKEQVRQEIMEHKEKRDNLKNNLTLGLTELYEEIKTAAGGTFPQDLVPYFRNALNKIEGVLAQKYEEMDIEEKVNLRVSGKKEQEEKERWKRLENDAVVNENRLVQRMAQKFGITDIKEASETYTKLMRGYARPIVDQLFDLSHPDLHECSSRELGEKYNKWYYERIASNPQMLDFIYQYSINALNTELLPYHIEKAVHGNTRHSQQIKTGKPQAPSNINREAPSPVNDDVAKTLKYFGQDVTEI